MAENGIEEAPKVELNEEQKKVADEWAKKVNGKNLKDLIRGR